MEDFMIKRFAASAAALFVILCAAYAYNPPYGGESMYRLVSPAALSGGSSAACMNGGKAVPESIAFNPAMIGGEQRWVVDAAGTLISDFAGEYGYAGQLGLLIPTTYGIAGFNAQGIFVSLDEMDYGNSITLRGAFAKDLSDELYVGVSLEGVLSDSISDGHWGLCGAAGFWYNIKKIRWLPFLKDARWGASLTGIGRPYYSGGIGISGGEQTGYPSRFTPRAGVAGTLFEADPCVCSLAMDVSFPSFLNAVFNAGLEFLFADCVLLKANWECNVREIIETNIVAVPSVSLGVKFGINAKNEFLTKQGWQQSELAVSAGYQYFDGGYHAVSAGATAYLGQKDTEAPELELWAGDK
ncbi:MAG: hypothetical protein NC041_01495 [Bacteroides sp.]|nr:hypothetical protein [Prevotella sp.]MCM1407723.1 hypothetical protein [Treponema brennaborense]MCM1469127.1 hypothetical protein [Bacteroides sp.]